MADSYYKKRAKEMKRLQSESVGKVYKGVVEKDSPSKGMSEAEKNRRKRALFELQKKYRARDRKVAADLEDKAYAEEKKDQKGYSKLERKRRKKLTEKEMRARDRKTRKEAEAKGYKKY